MSDAPSNNNASAGQNSGTPEQPVPRGWDRIEAGHESEHCEDPRGITVVLNAERILSLPQYVRSHQLSP